MYGTCLPEKVGVSRSDGGVCRSLQVLSTWLPKVTKVNVLICHPEPTCRQEILSKGENIEAQIGKADCEI